MIVLCGLLAVVTLALGWKMPLALALCPLAATCGVAVIRAGSRRLDDRLEARAHSRLASMALLMLLIALSALWLWGGGSLFTKDAGESHAIYLSAFNIHNLQTLFVQDLAASPDPPAHPFFYIHSPNLPNRLLSYLLIRIGIPLGQQVYITILIGIVALACGYAALQRMFSAWFALGALGFLGLTYNSYYYNVGDLLRGLLYVWFWLTLTVLAADPSLNRQRTGLVIAALSGIVMLSDWGYALFFYMFLLLWSSYASARLPVRWYLAHVVAPAVVALIIYQLAVISAVGWDFYLRDLAVTYLERMGIGGGGSYLSAFQAYQLHRVILWLGTAQRITFADLLAALAVAPALTSGPLWVGLLGVLCAAPVQTLRSVNLNQWVWAALSVIALLVFLGLVPLQIVVPACAGAAFLLAKVRQHDPSPTPVARMMTFITALWLAVLAEGAAFPYSMLVFVVGPARPPMPFLGMAAAGLVVHALAINRHHFRSWGELQGRARAWLNASRLRSIAFAVMLVSYLGAPFIALSRPEAVSYGFPSAVVLGIASFNVAVATAALFWVMRQADPHRQSLRSARLLTLARIAFPLMSVVILVLIQTLFTLL